MLTTTPKFSRRVGASTWFVRALVLSAVAHTVYGGGGGVLASDGLGAGVGPPEDSLLQINGVNDDAESATTPTLGLTAYQRSGCGGEQIPRWFQLPLNTCVTNHSGSSLSHPLQAVCQQGSTSLYLYWYDHSTAAAPTTGAFQAYKEEEEEEGASVAEPSVREEQSPGLSLRASSSPVVAPRAAARGNAAHRGGEPQNCGNPGGMVRVDPGTCYACDAFPQGDVVCSHLGSIGSWSTDEGASPCS